MSEYNGWTNYETWLTALWLGNDQGSESLCRELAQSAWDDTDEDADDRSGDAALALRDALKAEIEDNAPTGDSGLYADLLNAALSEVNWYEIAEHYINDITSELAE